jgi:hypothetical protein
MRKGTIPAFAWGTEKSHENLNQDISEILSWNLVSVKQECYTVVNSVRRSWKTADKKKEKRKE